MLSLPDRKKIPLTDIILPLFDPDRMEKCLPHPSVFIFVLFCFPKCLKLSACQITKIIFSVFWMDAGGLPVIIDDHPIFRWHTVCEMSSNQHDHITFGFQMADIHTPVETLKPCEFTEMVAFISDTTLQFYYPHYMWIGIIFEYTRSHGKSNS